MSHDLESPDTPAPPRRYRFHRDVDRVAPKPGHELATLTFERDGRHFVLWMIEGPENDTLTFRMMETDFETTRYSRFKVAGTAIEVLSDLPYSAQQHRVDYEIEHQGGSGMAMEKARVVYSTVRAPNGEDPDVAVMRVSGADGDCVVTITNLRRAWAPVLTVNASCMALAATAATAGSTKQGAAATGEQVHTLTVRMPSEGVEVTGHFTIDGGTKSSLAL